ncbi:hypothetical protein [Xanthobacter sediminis]
MNLTVYMTVAVDFAVLHFLKIQILIAPVNHRVGMMAAKNVGRDVRKRQSVSVIFWAKLRICVSKREKMASPAHEVRSEAIGTVVPKEHSSSPAEIRIMLTLLKHDAPLRRSGLGGIRI